MNWNILYNKTNDIKEIMRNILKIKGIKKEQVKDYINCNLKKHSPFLLNNMSKAIRTIRKHKNICVQSDFDADGVNGGYVMYRGLKEIAPQMGWNISIIIPERKDGYGLSRKNVDKAKELNCDCIITVDNGIAAVDAVRYAQGLGIEVIITDHHMPGEILPNCLIIDPQIDDYPFKTICGAMVAFKFISALYETLGIEMKQDDYEDYVTTVMIATIADIMSLVDENRTYVAEGLRYIQNTKNLGLRALIKEARIENIKADKVAFQIGPMINAAGRLKTPYIAFNLLVADDIVDATKYAKELVNLNASRRQLQKKTITEIPEEVLKDDFIVLYLPDTAKGILGTIASSISDKYKKPSFVLGGKHRLTGSGRSVNGYPIIDFIHSAKDFATGGGHAAAAGISILEEDIQKLRERCNAHYRKWLEEHGKEQEVLLDCVCEIDFDVCNMRFAENLDKLEPYGKDNMPLVFVSKNVKIKDCMILGETGNAIRFTFSKDNIDVKGIGFSSIVGLYKDNMNIVDIAYNIGINEWMGKKSLQLTVLDIKPVKNKVVTEGWTADLL